ncbi:MAG: exodeoxyribonuclease V subunit gamma, partial [Janthinobacterium lividum]
MLHVHRSESAVALVAGLADVLQTPAPGSDPFAPDLLAVGARGTERWIAQRLSHHLGVSEGSDPALADGICARIEFTSPARLLDGVLAEVVGRTAPGHAEAVERWSPESLTWHVLEVLDEIAPLDVAAAGSDDLLVGPADVFAVLRHHLRTPPGEDSPRVRRIALASRIAGLFARYGAARPQLLRDWALDRDHSSTQVPDDLRWQPEVFRRVRAQVGLPAPAELLDDVCAALRSD